MNSLVNRTWANKVNRRVSFLSIVIILLIAFSAPRVEARYKFFSEFGRSQEAKQASRWTLADWLAIKDKNRLADQWLAANTPSQLFEVMLSGAQSDFEIEIEEFEGSQYEAQLFASILGIQYKDFQWEDNRTQEYGLMLRVLGKSIQFTQLSLGYGLRRYEYNNPDFEVEQNYARAHLTLSVLCADLFCFGLEGDYSHYFPKTKEGVEFKGHRQEGAVYLEFGLLRAFYRLWTEAQVGSDARGVDLGVSLFF